jgi:hypothetical protein
MMIKNILCKIILPVFLLFSTVSVKLSYAHTNTPTKAELLLDAGKQLGTRAQVLCCEPNKTYENQRDVFLHSLEMTEMCHWSTHNNMIRQGTCDIHLTSGQCEQAAKRNRIHDGNNGYGGEFSDIEKPYGCIQKTDQKYYFNKNEDSKVECGPVHGKQFSEKCICYSRSCENKTYQEARNFCKKNNRQLCSKEQLRNLRLTSYLQLDDQGGDETEKIGYDFLDKFQEKFPHAPVATLRKMKKGPNTVDSSSPHWMNDFWEGIWASDGSRITDNDYQPTKQNYKWMKKNKKIRDKFYGDFTFKLNDGTDITMTREQILAYFNIDDYDALKQELLPERIPVEQIAEEKLLRALLGEKARNADWITVCEEDAFDNVKLKLKECADKDLQCYNTAIATATNKIEEPNVSEKNLNRTQCHGVLNRDILPKILRWCDNPDKKNCTTEKISKLFNMDEHIAYYRLTQSRVNAGYLQSVHSGAWECPCGKYKRKKHRGLMCHIDNVTMRKGGYSRFMFDLIQELQENPGKEIKEFIKNNPNQSEGE